MVFLTALIGKLITGTNQPFAEIYKTLLRSQIIFDDVAKLVEVIQNIF